MSRWQRIKAAPANAGRSIGRGFAAIGMGTAAIFSIFDLRDGLLFGGLGLLGYGFFQIYPPAAYIVPGAILVAVATFGTR